MKGLLYSFIGLLFNSMGNFNKVRETIVLPNQA